MNKRPIPKLCFIILFLTMAMQAIAATGIATSRPAVHRPYDEKAEALADVTQAISQARASGKNALIVFGANWCPECIKLDPKIHDRNGKLGEDRFVIVKVDVGQFDRNVELAQAYGIPIRKGIPAAAIVTPLGETIYSGPLINLIDPNYPVKSYLMKLLRKAMLPLGLVFGVGVLFLLLRRSRLKATGAR